MAATRGTNTQAEALQRLLADISQIKTMPDADLEWLIQLETFILAKLREPIEQMSGQMQGMAAGPPSPQPGMSPMGGGVPGGGMAGGPPGVMPGGQAPNPDELRRMLAGARPG